MKRLLEFEEFNEDRALDARLKNDNPRYPKIPVENVFLNPNIHAAGHNTELKEILDKFDEMDNPPVEDIKVEDLVPTQKYLTADNIDDVNKSLDDKVLKSTIVKYKDKYYIIDGHHRIARRILRGDETIPSHVYTVNK